MSEKLRFTKTEMTNAAKVAIEHNVTVRLTADGDMVISPITQSNDEKWHQDKAPFDFAL